MTVFIDLIGSWFVRISMLVILLTMILNMNEALYKRTTRAGARQVMAVVDTVLYADLTNACRNIDSSGTYNANNTFSTASAGNLQFYADTSSTTAAYLVKYSRVLNSGTGLYSLYRQIGSNPSYSLGNRFSQAGFKYYDASGTETPTLSSIRRVRVQLSTFLNNLGSADSVFTTDFSVYPSHIY
jgi:hypothetical protein